MPVNDSPYARLGIPEKLVSERRGRFSPQEIAEYAKKAPGAYGGTDPEHARREISRAISQLTDENAVPKRFAEYELELAKENLVKASNEVASRSERVERLSRERSNPTRVASIDEIRAASNRPAGAGGIDLPFQSQRNAADRVLQSGSERVRSFDNTSVRRIPLSVIEADQELQLGLEMSNMDPSNPKPSMPGDEPSIVEQARANTNPDYTPKDPKKPSISFTGKGETLELPQAKLEDLRMIRDGDFLRKTPVPMPENFEHVYVDLGIDEQMVRNRNGKLFSSDEVDEFVRKKMAVIEDYPMTGNPAADRAFKEAERARVSELAKALKDPDLQKIALEKLKLTDARVAEISAQSQVRAKTGALEDVVGPAPDAAKPRVRTSAEIEASIRRGESIPKDEAKRVAVHDPIWSFRLELVTHRQ